MVSGIENIETIESPFRRFVTTIGVFPTAFTDAMTYYECLAYLVKYLEETVIPAVNENAEALEELQTLFVQLKSYVDNYFENLDVQEEINNKLDEMAENGQLADIIAQYLQTQAIFGFNTIADMSASQNLANGSICKVLGKTNYQTGDGGFYKIRNITSDDVIDGVNKVAITNDNTLVAELITDYTFDILNERISNLNNKKYIFMGDSYADGYSPDGDTTSWITLLVQKLNLNASDYISSHQGGYGFSVNRPNNNYILLLQNLNNDTTITDMYVCGGYNDAGQTEADIIQGITDFTTLFRTKFPNAKLHLGFIGWSKNSNKIISLRDAIISYNKGCINNNIEMLDGCEYSLHKYFELFASDGIHPNQNGQQSITNAIYNCIQYGKANIIENVPLGLSGDNVGFSNFNVKTILNNSHVSLVSQSSTNVSSIIFTTPITMTGATPTEICDISNGLIIGSEYNSVSISLPCIIQESASVYTHQIVNLIFKNGKLYVSCPHASGNSYTSITAKAIQIPVLNGTFDALSC